MIIAGEVCTLKLLAAFVKIKLPEWTLENWAHPVKLSYQPDM
jgi:hypothetical protein